jgi:hypothetical protein
MSQINIFKSQQKTPTSPFWFVFPRTIQSCVTTPTWAKNLALFFCLLPFYFSLPFQPAGATRVSGRSGYGASALQIMQAGAI